jgi:hypothetical protein
MDSNHQARQTCKREHRETFEHRDQSNTTDAEITRHLSTEEPNVPTYVKVQTVSAQALADSPNTLYSYEMSIS